MEIVREGELERLRTTEAKRRALTAELDRVATTASARPAWRDAERRMRARLKDWRSLLTGDDVAETRQGIRELLTTAIKFPPFVDARGFKAIRFEGRWGLEAVFGGELTGMASPTGIGQLVERVRLPMAA